MMFLDNIIIPTTFKPPSTSMDIDITVFISVKSEAWIDYPNMQYYMPSFSASYFDAIEYCKQLGGSLAQLNDPQK